MDVADELLLAGLAAPDDPLLAAHDRARDGGRGLRAGDAGEEERQDGEREALH